ncbi:hypothetical protein [Paenibacillus sp. BAC0078]
MTTLAAFILSCNNGISAVVTGQSDASGLNNGISAVVTRQSDRSG